MYKPKRITHIMDVDGFMVDKRFLCKDLAVVSVLPDVEPASASFLLGRRYYDLSKQDRVSASYVYRRIHGLPFKDIGVELYEQAQVGAVVKLMTGQSSDAVVAYKGGHIERDILTSAGIPSVDLEGIGCPKFDKLICDPTYGDSHEATPCELHEAIAPKAPRRGVTYHCPRREVAAFKLWYLKYLEQYDN